MSGVEEKRLRSGLNAGHSVLSLILPKRRVSRRGKPPKYEYREEDELISGPGGEIHTIIEWAQRLHVPTRKVLTVLQRPETLSKIKVESIYRVRYYLFFEDHTELRFADVRSKELNNFLRFHIFSRVVGERKGVL